ncbi:GNAT family N-acetyltransferase [Flavilitoribacter nigricans]|uniref:GNAT family N-acetyltransferase n=1 Tax=Flavilitoribacter nigricans (strain ATCC 23147 / DSM 23189 / NBRC 102662 / NCIMB 1420 / SS-2) TaxID=1122177 RepID=A0A2D0MZ49_FLAN2|nr:N-acetyltransferase [Flavilitoribacter nigricans]PHN01525.1 GNAT family N-acetyltransferase [Flavilitoribacter nigricans DSM 23189 = NBRC 102662]
MELRFRKEEAADFAEIAALIQAAFASEPHSDHREHLLVDRLRRSAAYIPELALVARCDDRICGYILLTRAHIQNDKQQYPVLALAPVAVHPAWHKRGIGSQLILEAHRRAAALGHAAIVLLGHADYYPRFGYETAVRHHITFPFDVPNENCMVKALEPTALSGISGEVVYAPAFFETDA